MVYQNKKPAQPSYKFLPKRLRNICDTITYDQMFLLLDDDKNLTMFNFVIGVIADLEVKNCPLSEEQQRIRMIPKHLFERAVTQK